MNNIAFDPAAWALAYLSRIRDYRAISEKLLGARASLKPIGVVMRPNGVVSFEYTDEDRATLDAIENGLATIRSMCETATDRQFGLTEGTGRALAEKLLSDEP